MAFGKKIANVVPPTYQERRFRMRPKNLCLT